MRYTIDKSNWQKKVYLESEVYHMKTRKIRLLSALLALAMLLALLPTAAFAADNIVDQGTCGAEGDGSNVTWELDSDGTLTISGTGAMANYNYGAHYNDQPWVDQRTSITRVVVEGSVTTIGMGAFHGCTELIEADMSNALNLEMIRQYAFSDCMSLKTVKLPQKGSLKTIEHNAFSFYSDSSEANALQIEEIIIPASVEKIYNHVFDGCSKLTKVIFESPSSLKDVAGWNFANCSENLKIYGDENVKNALAGKTYAEKFSSLDALNPVVTFEVDGEVFVKQNAKDNNFKAAKPETPTKKGYQFTGWYTKDDNDKYELFDFDTTITENITLYAQWEKLPDHQLTVIGGTFAVKDETIETETKDDAVIANIPVDAEVTVAFNKEAYADSNQTFDGWVIEGLDDAENYTNQETFTFTMPQNGVRIEAMTKFADVEDSGWDAATVVTGAVIGTGTAILAYHIGLEVYAEQVLGKGVAVPRTRGEVALLAWQLAGSPAVNGEGEPLSEAAQAEKWAVESGLMQPDAEGNFNGAKKMSKLKALRTLEKAKQ